MRLETKEAAPYTETVVSTDLAVITTVQAIEFFKPNGSDEILAKLKEEVRKQAASLDISTEVNRAAIASLAYKVARSKTALDEQGKKLVESEKARLKAIDKERAHVWDEMEALQKEVRQPLTEWENADKERIAAHKGEIATFEALASGIMQNWLNVSLESMRQEFARLDSYTRYWEEFNAPGIQAWTNARAAYSLMITRREQHEAEQAELARLRAEAAERAIREREEAAAKAAADRERALAEQRAQEAQRAAERERQRVEHERAEAEAGAKQAEAQKIAQEALAERLLAEAEQRRIAEEQKAERDRIAQEERHRLELQAEEKARKAEAEEWERRRKAEAAEAERKQLEAVEAERQRVAAEKRREAEEAEKRAKNRAHQAAINREILAALAMLNVPEESGKLIIAAIAKGTIPHVSIQY